MNLGLNFISITCSSEEIELVKIFKYLFKNKKNSKKYRNNNNINQLEYFLSKKTNYYDKNLIKNISKRLEGD